MGNCTSLFKKQKNLFLKGNLCTSRSSIVEILENFDNQWNALILAIRKEIPAENHYLIDLVQHAPNIISFIKENKVIRNQRGIFKLLKLFNKKQCLYKVDIDGILGKISSILTQLDSSLDRVRKPIINTITINENGQRIMLLSQFEDMVLSHQQIISDAYKCQDKKCSEQIISDAINSLDEYGYSVIEFSGDNMEFFDIKYANRKNELMVCPCIMEKSTNRIIQKGLVYLPNN